MGNCVVLLALICSTSILGEDLVPHFTISLLYIVGTFFHLMTYVLRNPVKLHVLYYVASVFLFIV